MAADFDPGIDGLSRFEAIGRGGYSTVYSAWEEGFSRHVAVKILHHLDEAAERRFDRERSLMGRTSGHPNVITPIRSGRTTDGAPFLVMQYLEGGSLQDLVKRGETVAWPEAVALLRPIAEALGHSHAAGILHKDVKPANILLAANGSASLTDFGIAGVLGSTATETAFTFAHTPPEAFLGAGDESDGGDGRDGRDGRDERSDLYSLASTLYTIVAGRSPFAATTEEEEALLAWMHRVTNHPVEPTGLDPDLDDFLIRSLAKRPDERPQSAAEFLAGLDRLLEADRDVAATPMEPASKTSSWVRPELTQTTAEPGARPGWVVPAVVACAVALVASLVTLQATGSGERLLPGSSETATEQGLPVATSTGPTDTATDPAAGPAPSPADNDGADTEASEPSSAEVQRAAILLQDPDNPARALLTGSLLPTAETDADDLGFTFESCEAELAELDVLLGGAGAGAGGLRAAFSRWPSGSPRGYRDPAGEDRGFRERLGAAVEQARTGYRQCQDRADLSPVGPWVLGGWASLQAFLCVTGVAERVVLSDRSSESCPADDELALCSSILAPLLDDFFAAFPDLRPDPTATCRAAITDNQEALAELSGRP